MSKHPRQGHGDNSVIGFTLVEILIVISIIAVLVALLMPAVGLIRESARKAEATQAVAQLVSSFEAYATVDPSKRYPYPGPLGLVNPYGPTATTYYRESEGTNPELAFSIAQGDNRSGAPLDGVLKLLEQIDLPIPQPRYDRSDADRRLLDPWGHPYHYRLGLDGATRSALSCPHNPSAVITMTDWNWDSANNRESLRTGRDVTIARPYPYVYSWGKLGTATDSCTWIYGADKR